MFSTLNNNLKGMILAFVGFSCFALADAYAKWMTLRYEPSQIVGMTALFSVLFCVVFSPFLGGLGRTLRTRKLRFHLGRGGLNILVSLLLVFSFSKLSLAGVASMIFVTPFIMALLARRLFGDLIGRQGWLAIIAGFIGVLIVVQPGVGDVNPYLFVPLGTTVLMAVLYLLARPLDEDETLLSLAFYPALANFLVISPVVLYVYGLPEFSDLGHFAMQAALVMTGLIMTALAFRLTRAALVAPFMYFEMVWGVGFDYFLFYQSPALEILIGAGVIILSGVYLVVTERRS